MGAVHCCKAVWPLMQAQQYGRIAMTTSSSGLYGNFGQSNYGAAKMALVGLMQTLSLEGAKSNIRVNCLAPTAATRMTEGLLPAEVLALLKPEAVTPALLWLVSEGRAPTAPSPAPAPAPSKPRTSPSRTGLHLGSGADVPEQPGRRMGPGERAAAASRCPPAAPHRARTRWGRRWERADERAGPLPSAHAEARSAEARPMSAAAGWPTQVPLVAILRGIQPGRGAGPRPSAGGSRFRLHRGAHQLARLGAERPEPDARIRVAGCWWAPAR